jgi:signal transduction histidine kinase
LQVPLAFALVAPKRTRVIASTTAFAFLPLVGSLFVRDEIVQRPDAVGVMLTYAGVGPLAPSLGPYGLAATYALARWSRENQLPDRDFVGKVLVAAALVVVPAGLNDMLMTSGAIRSVLMVDLASCIAVIGLLRAMTVRSTHAYEQLLAAISEQDEILRQGERDMRVAQKLADLGRIVEHAVAGIDEPLQTLAMRLSSVSATVKQIEATSGDETTADARKLAEEASDGARKMLGTVAMLRDFARPADHDRAPCDLVTTVERALRVAQNDLSHRARLVTRFDGRPIGSANPNRLAEAFVHLAIHAAASIPSERWGTARVIVEVASDGDLAKVRVSDEGASITDAELARLFDPYAVTVGLVDHAGLQLAMCHRIVTSLGGHITVEAANPGKVVTVTLPRARDEVARVAS